MSEQTTIGPRQRRVIRQKYYELVARAGEIDRQLETVSEQIELNETRLKYLEDFYAFCKDIMGFGDLYEQLHRPVCELVADDAIRKKLILLPRGTFKSTLCSICYPLWQLARDPNSRIALCSVSSVKAEENLAEVIDRAKRPEYQRLFGEVVGSPDDWPICRKDQIKIKRRGARTGPSIAAYSIECSDVGRHFDKMIFDDLVDQERVNTPTARDSVWQWFGRQLSVADPNSVLTIIGTRWHWDDVYSRIQKQLRKFDPETKEGWYVEKKAIGTKPPPEYGELLFPTRFTKADLEDIRSTQGDYVFSCFYFNDPVGQDLNPFDVRKVKFTTYKRSENARRYILVDPASSREEWADYSGIIIGDALDTREFVVVEAILEKLHPDALIDRILGIALRENPYAITIEDEACQKSYYCWLRREMLRTGRFWTLRNIPNPKGVNQYRRLLGLQPFIHSGSIKIAEDCIGKEALLEELETYPKGPHDDLLCALFFATFATYPEVMEPEADKPLDPRFRTISRLIERAMEKPRSVLPTIQVNGGFRWRR